MKLPTLEPVIRNLSDEEFGSTSELIDLLGTGTLPVAVMLTCSELGTAPDEIAHAEPEEVVIVQNFGALALPASTTDSYVATIITALQVPSVRHLIVCGHTACKPLALQLSKDRRAVNPFRELLRPMTTRFQATYEHRPQEHHGSLLIQESVLEQLANLRSHHDVQMRLRNGTLSLHGWIRDDETAAVSVFNPTDGQFQSQNS